MPKTSTETLYQRIQSLITHLSRGLYERDEALRLSLLAALSGQSIFFLGPPGVAKSMVARRISEAFSDSHFFEYLMGRFSTPDELFGPVSISRLKHEDKYSRNTQGFLPDADIVFLDEIWKASPPIQNTLLSALNERKFRNGDEVIDLPLKCFIAASNEILESDETRAFWDRFLIRIVLSPIDSADNFKELIGASGGPAGSAETEKSTADGIGDAEVAPNKINSIEWQSWLAAIEGVKLSSDVLHLMTVLRTALSTRAESDVEFYISDRRWKTIAYILRASAYFHGRESVSLVDCCLIPHCIWNRQESRQQIQEIFDDCIGKTALVEAAGVMQFSQEYEDFKLRLTEEALDEVETTVYEPVRYDGEYLLFVPAEDGSEQSYRIWADDLENLDERGELEFFVHKRGSFSHTEVHAMHWTDKSQWKLDGEMGSGHIDCELTSVKQMVPGVITEQIKTELKQQSEKLAANLEETISGLQQQFDSIRSQTEQHLFIPGTQIGPIQGAAETRRVELENILASLIELKREQELE